MTGDMNPKRKYHVKLGNVRVSVDGTSKEEAIRNARIKLSDDMPRLYDVIHRREDAHFHVDEV